MSSNLATVHRYLDGFMKNDHAQILSCLTDDVAWTVFGLHRVHGKEAYAANIEGPGFVEPPVLHVVRTVEHEDVVMAELSGTVRHAEAGIIRMSMAELFVMRDGLICERRAWVIPLQENDYR